MIRRLFVWSYLLGYGLLLVTGTAEAQCTGYSITSTSVNLLHPTQAAAQGNVTATITVQASDLSSARNHKITVTPGVWIGYAWSSANSDPNGQPPGDPTKGPYSYYTKNNDPTPYQAVGASTGGTNPHAWATQASDVGNTYYLHYVVPGLNGTSTQDIDTITVVAGNTPNIVDNDGVWTNAYYQLVSTFGGGSMMNSCGECQGGETQHCLQATHTPLFDATLTNPRTGETQTISNASAGNVATATESVSGTASIMISVLPGDSPSGSTTNKIYCTMFGWVMAQQWNPGLPDIEMAVTAEEIIPSTCTLVLRFFQQGDDWGINCNVAWKKPPATADRCSVASQVPDFNPAAQWDEQNCKVPGNCSTSDMPPPNGTNVSYPKYWYHASWGVRFPPGAPSPDPPILNGGAHNWTFPIYLAEGYVPAGPNQDWWILDLLNLAIPKGTGLPIDCTYRDHGTRPIPNPF